MADLATLSIKAEQSGVNATAKSLDRLSKAASAARNPILDINQALAYLKATNVDSFAAAIDKASAALGGSKTGFKDFVTSASALNKSSTSFTNLTNSAERLVGNTAGLTGVASQLERIQTALAGMKGSAGTISKLSNVGGASSVTIKTDSGGYKAATASVNGLSQAQNRLISQIERESFLVSKSKAEWYD